MPKRSDTELIRDIKEAITRIQTYIGKMSYNDFLKDTKTQDSVVRNLEIIGEAAKFITDGLKGRYPEIKWKGLAGVRDRLIHRYFGVNFDIVWAVASEELPSLLIEIERISSK